MMTLMQDDRQCDGSGTCYARGARDARRTVEAEVEAERAALAVLAASLAEAVDGLRLILHPRDAALLDTDAYPLPIGIDRMIEPGAVRIELPRQLRGVT